MASESMLSGDSGASSWAARSAETGGASSQASHLAGCTAASESMISGDSGESSWKKDSSDTGGSGSKTSSSQVVGHLDGTLPRFRATTLPPTALPPFEAYHHPTTLPTNPNLSLLTP